MRRFDPEECPASPQRIAQGNVVSSGLYCSPGMQSEANVAAIC